MTGGFVSSGRSPTSPTMKSDDCESSPNTSNHQENAKLMQAVNDYACKVVNEKFPLYEQSELLPQFTRDEIIRGKLLGSGFFGDVYEVKDIVLDGEENVDDGVRNKAKQKKQQKQEQHQQQQRHKAYKKLLCFCNKRSSEWEVRENANDTMDSMEELDGLYVNEEDEDSLGYEKDDELILAPPKDARAFMKQHCHRFPDDSVRDSENVSSNKTLRRIVFSRQKRPSQKNGQARYAIKVLRKEIFHDPTKLYYQGVMDLNSETRLLANLQDHPNICKLRATGLCNKSDKNGTTTSTTFHQDYFIVLDRLYQVLDDRLAQWEKRSQRYHSLLGKLALDINAKHRKKLWIERLYAGHGLASALAHIHSKNMIHRDLKVENIGFDIRGDIKLFDFGLARELPKEGSAGQEDKNVEDKQKRPNDWGNYSYGSIHKEQGSRPYAYSTTWNLTGETGTPRYMAPEAALNQPYNASCDTYSFCVLFWQILMLKKPFELYTARAMA
ncbi:MAG: hypothetical protein SGARI_002109 [Bacillariaceae sp.]